MSLMQLPFEPPIERILHDEFNRNGVEVYVKREDMIHPFISGNKWRKLKYVLEDASAKHTDTLVSFGGAYSNHLVALACAGARYGYKTHAFVRGEQAANHMLGLCEMYGMNLQFVSREAYRNKPQLFDQYFGSRQGVMFIDEGGRGKHAMRGCSEMLDHISPGFTHVICAVGTGTTLAGLAQAASFKGIKSEGICVLKAESLTDEIGAMIPGVKEWKVHHGFHFGGYAKTTPELLSFMKDFASRTGILTDQVYTAKMFYAVRQLIHQKYYPPGSRLLLIHTGGLLGALSQWADTSIE